MLGRRPLVGRLILLLAVGAVALGMAMPPAWGSAPAQGIAVSLGSDGTAATGLDFVVANGSALRYAMDGYFGPLVDELPGTNASRSALLAEINATEDNPIFAGLFGDRDGTVNSVDVDRFQSLISSESRLIPVSTLTGVLNVTMDGKGPLSDQLVSIGFSDALGADDSSAPMGVIATLDVTFEWSGVGNPHTFMVAWNLPSILGNLSVPVEPVNLSFRTPPAITITSVTGLSQSHLSNDPFGWGPASASGQYLPLPGHTIVIRFGPSFPTGDALIIGGIVAAVGVGVGFLLIRRRRRRRPSSASPSGPASEAKAEVGPSSGSG